MREGEHQKEDCGISFDTSDGDAWYRTIDKTRMAGMRKPHRRGAYGIGLSTWLPLLILALSLSSIVFVARYTAEIMVETIETVAIEGIDGSRGLSSRATISKVGKTIIEQKQSRGIGTINARAFLNIRSGTKLEHIAATEINLEHKQHYRYKLGLIRILGNAIPPKGDEHQTLQNLEFLLANEPAFESTVDKHWILNRIASDDFLRRISWLLNRYNQTFSVLPFRIEEYESKPYRYVKASKTIALGINNKNNQHHLDLIRNRSFWETKENHEGTRGETDQERNKYVDELYVDKKRYVTNQNNARNFAIEWYSSKNATVVVDYVLPWDGDCFLSEKAHEALHNDLEKHNDEQQQRIRAARALVRSEVRADDDDVSLMNIGDDFIDSEIRKFVNPDSIHSGKLNAPINYFYAPVSEQQQIGGNHQEGETESVSNIHFKPIQTKGQLPQIVLHRNAKKRFDPNGTSEVSVLQKLQIEGPWNGNIKDYIIPPYDYNYYPHLSEERGASGFLPYPELGHGSGAVATPAVGWATRSVSGKSNLGAKNDASLKYGMVAFYQELDALAVSKIHYASDDKQQEADNASPYMFYNQTILEMEARAWGKENNNAKESDQSISSLSRLVQKLIESADLSLQHKHENLTIRDRRSLEGFLSNFTVLGLAYELTGKRTYAKRAAELIQKDFVDPETLWYPTLGEKKRFNLIGDGADSPQRVKFGIADFKDVRSFIDAVQMERKAGASPYDSFDLLDFKDIYFFLDAMRMVEKSGELSETQRSGVRDWFRMYLDQLVSSGKVAYYDDGYRGLYYDIQLISIATFVGNHTLAVKSAHESVSRLIGDINKLHGIVDGRLSLSCEDNLMFTLEGWIVMARMLSKMGIELWKKLPVKREFNVYSQKSRKQMKKEKYQPVLCRAPVFAFLLSQDPGSCAGRSPSEFGRHGGDEYDRWLPIHATVQQWDCPSPKRNDDEQYDTNSHYAMEPLYDFSPEYSGYHSIAPFWNLGLGIDISFD